MKKLYLISLRIFDSRDAGFPLNYKEVTMLKREIFFEFLRHNADEHIAVDLFGDLSTPAEIFHLLSLVPKEIPLKISQSDSILKGLKFNENINLLDEPFVMDAISNPVISSKPSFLMKEDGQELIIESGLNGCVPVELERPEDPGEGKIGFFTRFIFKSEADQAKMFGNRIIFECRDPGNSLEKRLLENLSSDAAVSLIRLMDMDIEG